MRKFLVYRRPENFISRSGLAPLAEAVSAEWLDYPPWKWWVVYDRCWQAGTALQRFGRWFYRSEWSDRVPLLGDLSLSRKLPRGERSILHFLFAEFSTPRWRRPYRSRGGVLIGTFHASPGRQERVHGRMNLGIYDWISVVSETQIPFFLERGYPQERLRVTHHGVDTDYFNPAVERGEPEVGAPLKGLIVGSTERDHVFAAELMKRLPAGVLSLSVAAPRDLHACYQEVPGINLLPHLPDAGMLAVYQQADLLVMPLNGATANNALLESMACGTPVMVNRIGGVPEYVDSKAGILMDDKNVEDWIETLKGLANHRHRLASMRDGARRCAESQSWGAVASQYLELYQDAMSGYNE